MAWLAVNIESIASSPMTFHWRHIPVFHERWLNIHNDMAT